LNNSNDTRRNGCRHTIKHGGISLLCFWHGLMVLLIQSPSAIASPPGKNDLAHIHQQLNTLRKQKQSNESERSRNENALRTSELAISRINRDLRDLQEREQATQDGLAATDRQINAVRQSAQAQQDALSSLLRHLYINSNQPNNDLQLLFGNTNVGDTQRDSTLASYLQHSRQAQIARLHANATELDALRTHQQMLQQQLAQQQRQQEQQIRLLKTEQQNRQVILAKLGSTIALQQQQITSLEEDEKRMTRLLEELARAAAKREAARKEAARRDAVKREAERRANLHHAPRTEHPEETIAQQNISQPEPPAIGFGQMKGKLPMPTAGTLIHRFGTPREAGGTLWKGLFIKAPAGQRVVSVGAGQVVFADWLRGFGNLIIIDHGEGYMSLYSDNETLYKKVGDIVKAGDIIAAVGNTGGNAETGLYFELRYRSQAFDPYRWLLHP